MDKNSSLNEIYALATGAKGAPRLDLQDRFLFENTQNFLAKAGLSEGKVVFDIGCGNGVMTAYLAKVVGPSGHVYAVDISADQLELVKKRIQAEQLENVTLFQADITKPHQLPRHLADIINIRFVLMHLRDPAGAIISLKSSLKPNGVIASQEPVKSTLYSSFETEIFADYMRMLVEMAKCMGVDYEIGDRLRILYENCGFAPVHVYDIHQSVSLMDAKQLCQYALEEMQSKIISTGVGTQAEIDCIFEAIKRMPINDKGHEFKIARQVYALARV